MEDDESVQGSYVTTGEEYVRDTRYIETRITADGRDGYPVEPGRYRLVAARACPWANRTLIVRRLLGLEDAISLGLCGPTHDADSWTFDLDPGGVDQSIAPCGSIGHENLDRFRRNGADRRHNPKRDGQVVMAAFLGEIGR